LVLPRSPQGEVSLKMKEKRCGISECKARTAKKKRGDPFPSYKQNKEGEGNSILWQPRGEETT